MTTNIITLRVAGPYTITSDGERIYCNGNHATPMIPPAGAQVAWVLDTGCKGANGKRDVVGLTAEQYAAHRAHGDALRGARLAADAASPKGKRAALVSALEVLIEADYQARHDAVETLRTTGKAPVSKDLSNDIAAARAALAAFDGAHPEVRDQTADDIAPAGEGRDW